MNSTLRRLALLACACGLGACASSGNRTIRDVTQESAAPLIHVGTSTKSDIKQVFGDARIVNRFANAQEVWSYRYADKAESKISKYLPDVGAITRRPEKLVHELVIQFNPAGVVMKFRVHDGVDEG